MSRLRVQCFGISIDGFGAGPGQDLANPMGVGGLELHQWAFKTRTSCQMHGWGDGEMGVDEDFARRGFENVGAWILGRNMFGPVRDQWDGESWKGWWGDNPPYHTPVFVLTHFARDPLVMEGGTVFHFVTDGIEAALERARAAAGEKDVRLGGGVSTIRKYLCAGLVNVMHLVISPVLLGAGESLLAGIDLVKLGFCCTGHVASTGVTHVVLTRRP
jgi:dihydrofolate reductase